MSTGAGVGVGRWLGLLLATLLVAPGCDESAKLAPGRAQRGAAEAPAVPAGPDALPETPDPGVPPHPPTPPAEPFARVPQPNPIPGENGKPGSPDWRTGTFSRGHQIELYTGVESGFAGDTVDVKVHADIPTQARIDIYRLGFYGGAGARRVWSGGPYAVGPQPACPRDPATSRIECNWTTTFQFQVGQDWVSGLYLVKARRTDGHARFTPFVVRDHRAADVLFAAAFSTYQAYNKWGGESLYYDASGTMPNGRAYEVSFNRPYEDNQGSGQLLYMEYALIRFLEQHGYDVTYGSNVDFSRFERFADGVGAFVHGGHDEYWTAKQRADVDRLLASGKTSLAHFGGNGAYWRMRLTEDRAGQPLRTVVCFKNEPEKDPEPHSTIRFRDEPDAHPENALFGTMYDGWMLKGFPLVVVDPYHWLLEGTGLQQGELLPDLVGYEFDKVMDNGFSPAEQSIPFESAVVTAENVPSRSHLVERTLPQGTLVFSAGTIYWPRGLSAEYRDVRVERMTLNVLERALAHRRPPRALAPLRGPIRRDPEPIPAWADEVQARAGVPGVAGFVDGPADSARFDGPTGVAMGADARIFVADTRNHAVRVIGTDLQRTVRTVAGRGVPGFRDGPGEQAMFRYPTAVAVAPDGGIFVADSANHVIRRIENDAPVHTVSTYAGTPQSAGYADGAPESARFSRPTAVALDANGNLYVADQAGQRIRVVLAGTREVQTLAGSGAAGFADAEVGVQAQFNHPSAIAVSPEGDLLVVDGGNNRIRRVRAAAPHAVETLAGGGLVEHGGFQDGQGSDARMRAQMGLAFDTIGQLLFADTGSNRIRKLTQRPLDGQWRVYTVAGSGRQGTRLGAASDSDIVAPAGLAYTPAETLIVSDSFNHVIREVYWPRK